MSERNASKKKKGPLLRLSLATLYIVIALFVAARIYYYLTDDFREGNITYEMPYESSWQIAPLTQQEEAKVNQILNQPWHYIGKGAQSYAFVSEDDRYVLKFFKFKHLRPSWFLDSLPPIGPLKDYKDTQAARKERKLFGVFQSYKLAYDQDRKESGLVFIQLNTVGNPQRSVVVIDKLGISRKIELAEIPFILQDKGQTLRNVLRELLDHGDVVTTEYRLGQILDMYAGEYQRGLFDHDHGVMQNTGFVGERPIHLDVGKLLRDESMKNRDIAKKDAQLVTNNMKEWIGKNFPEYKERLSQFLDRKVQQLYD